MAGLFFVDHCFGYIHDLPERCNAADFVGQIHEHGHSKCFILRAYIPASSVGCNVGTLAEASVQLVTPYLNITPMIMNMLKYVLCSLLLLVAGCDVKVGVQGQNNRSYNVRGVQYVVPWETSSHEETPGTFKYRGDSVSFTDSQGVLQVNGRNYGTVKTRDVVNLTTKGKVFVNGTERSAQ